MRYTVKVRGSVDHGEWKLEDVMEGRAGDSIAAAIRAFPRKYEVEADSTQEAAAAAREKHAADETIDELWVSDPKGGADVFDREVHYLRHEDEMP